MNRDGCASYTASSCTHGNLLLIPTCTAPWARGKPCNQAELPNLLKGGRASAPLRSLACPVCRRLSVVPLSGSMPMLDSEGSRESSAVPNIKSVLLCYAAVEFNAGFEQLLPAPVEGVGESGSMSGTMAALVKNRV